MARHLDRNLATHLAQPDRAATRTDLVPLHPSTVDGCDCRIARRPEGCTDRALAIRRAILREPQHRIARLTEALNAIHRIILFGLVMDLIYQGIALDTFYPTEAVIIVLLLAVVPYVLLRGLITHAARMFRRDASAHRI
jgi:hypothetical protein